MKTNILILVKVAIGVDYYNLVQRARREIALYFGYKNTWCPNFAQPIMIVSTEVTQEDLDIIKKQLSEECIQLVLLKNWDESGEISGNTVELS